MTSLDTELLDNVARGLLADGGSLDHGVAIEIPPDKRNSKGWPSHFIAARISVAGESTDLVGAWAVAEIGESGPGAIWAINETAVAHSDWGTAMSGGSRAASNREHLRAYPELAEAVRSVGD